MILDILLALWPNIKYITDPLVQQIISLEQEICCWTFGPDIFVGGSKGQQNIENLEIMADTK